MQVTGAEAIAMINKRPAHCGEIFWGIFPQGHLRATEAQRESALHLKLEVEVGTVMYMVLT